MKGSGVQHAFCIQQLHSALGGTVEQSVGVPPKSCDLLLAFDSAQHGQLITFLEECGTGFIAERVAVATSIADRHRV